MTCASVKRYGVAMSMVFCGRRHSAREVCIWPCFFWAALGGCYFRGRIARSVAAGYIAVMTRSDRDFVRASVARGAPCCDWWACMLVIGGGGCVVYGSRRSAGRCRHAVASSDGGGRARDCVRRLRAAPGYGRLRSGGRRSRQRLRPWARVRLAFPERTGRIRRLWRGSAHAPARWVLSPADAWRASLLVPARRSLARRPFQWSRTGSAWPLRLGGPAAR